MNDALVGGMRAAAVGTATRAMVLMGNRTARRDNVRVSIPFVNEGCCSAIKEEHQQQRANVPTPGFFISVHAEIRNELQ
jgi:hypothetical protein